MEQIKFNPNNQKYKKTEDLPKAFRDDYEDVDNGFVKKEAKEANLAAEKLAFKYYKEGRLENTNHLDILREDALQCENSEKRILEKIKQEEKMFEITDFVKEEIDKNPFLAEYKGFFLKVLKAEPYALEYASPELRNDKDLVLLAVSGKGRVIEFASERLRNDEEVMSTAIKNDGVALRYASEQLRDDKEAVMAAVTNGSALRYASERLCDDKEVVMAAVTNGMALRYASERLRDDKEVVMAAIATNEDALRYASERLRDDKEVVMAVVTDASALKYASERLRDDKEVVIAFINNNRFSNIEIIDNLSEKIKNDIDILMAMANNNFFDIVPAKLENNREFVLLMAKKGLCRFNEISTNLRGDREVAKEIIRNFPEELWYAPSNIRNDDEIVQIATDQKESLIQLATIRLKLRRKFKAFLNKKKFRWIIK